MNLNGKGSWFGGPNDSSDSGHTALGGTTKEPGIAVYNHGTLGGYWRVTAPNGKTVVVKQTDIGPAPWTGRKIDVTYSALNKFGYGEHNFPTDQEFKAQYLGKNQPKGGGGAIPMPPEPAPKTTTIPGIAATPSSQVGTFDQAGFDKANKASIIGKLISSEGGQKDNPLFTTGLLSTKAPVRSAFEGVKTLPGTPGTPAQQVPAAPSSTSAGGKLGGLIPAGQEVQIQRIDKGQDIKTKPGGPLVASGDFEVVGIHNDPGGFGERYPVIKFTSGPEAGKTLYFGHTHSNLPLEHKGHAGEVISRTGYGTPREGNARTPGWAEIGLWGPNGPGGPEEGKKIAPYLRR